MNRIERAGERCWVDRDGVVIVDDGDWVTIWESDPATDGRADHFQDVQALVEPALVERASAEWDLVQSCTALASVTHMVR